MSDKLEIVGTVHYNPRTDRLNVYGESEEQIWGKSVNPIILLNSKMSECFAPKLPKGAIWENEVENLGKLKITIERVEDVPKL